MSEIVMKLLRSVRKPLPISRAGTRFWLMVTVTLWLLLFVAIVRAFGLIEAGFWKLVPVAFWLVPIVAGGELLIWLRVRRRRGKQPPADREAREAFARSQEKLCDLYIDLWYCAEKEEGPDGGRWKTLERWRERLERLEEPALLRAWVAATGLSSPGDDAWTRRGAVRWLRTLESWGLTRDHPSTVEINEQSLRRFQFFPRRGSGIAVVESPSWSFNGVVLQKGHAVAKSGQAAS